MNETFPSQKQAVPEHDPKGHSTNDVAIGRIFREYEAGNVSIPNMPDVALRVRKLASDPRVDIDRLTRVIETDPPIAGRLIAIANSAALRGREPINRISDVVLRLGLNTSVSLTISMAMKDLFRSSYPRLNRFARWLWANNVHVASMARIIAQRDTDTERIDADKAFLVGLLHRIGAMTLLGYFAEHSPQVGNRELLSAVDQVGRLASVLVIEHWRLDQDYLLAAEAAGDWENAGSDVSPYVDIVNLARHQSAIVDGESQGLPPVQQIHAYRIVAPEQPDEHGLLPSLADHPQIADMRKHLS